MYLIDEEITSLVKTLSSASNYFEDKRVLITGGAGFLGSWMCDLLLGLNADVICLDNFSSGLATNIEHLMHRDGFFLIKHDISKPISLKKKVDVIFHFASRASPLEFTRFPIQILKANTLGTWVTLGIAKKYLIPQTNPLMV